MYYPKLEDDGHKLKVNYFSPKANKKNDDSKKTRNFQREYRHDKKKARLENANMIFTKNGSSFVRAT